ncbi:MAG TPA: hypothetical protein VLH35_03205, partial [Candidatus Acidoferrales bacterium]|nr:hypothetical protein [Candidatus Acidoferrales bacterium]
MVIGEGSAGFASNASEGIFGDIHQKAFSSVKEVYTSAQIPKCPNNCPENTKIYRDGLRYNEDGSITQRWKCNHCGLRFSDKALKRDISLTNSCQICAKGAKNLHVPTRKHVGAGVLTDETKAAIKIFEGWLRKEGYSESRYPNNIKTLVYLGANLSDPEDVKKKLGDHPIKDGAKLQYVYAYDAFVKMNHWTWEPPRCKQEETIPFIPEESELDQLIAATQSRRMATYLQTLKETFADPGEGLKIDRKDVSGNYITINHPVKGHRPRTLEVSNKLIAMLNSLPNDGTERFFNTSYNLMCNSYIKMRKRVAEATKNERINYIELRTFRHWGGT